MFTVFAGNKFVSWNHFYFEYRNNKKKQCLCTEVFEIPAFCSKTSQLILYTIVKIIFNGKQK